jgi:hypothetical protein
MRHNSVLLYGQRAHVRPHHLHLWSCAGLARQSAVRAGGGQQAAAATVEQSVSANVDQLQQLRLQATLASQSLPMVCICPAAKEVECCNT